MANELTRVGYGQVEPNHLSAQRTGQIYAQLPVAHALMDSSGTFAGVLENGMFVKYDYEAGVCNLTGDGEWMLVFNEVKLYESGQTLADFAMKHDDAVDAEVVPRVFKTNVGDIYTTNCVHQDASGVAVVGAQLTVGADGLLEKHADATTHADAPVFNVVAVTTMPDGQDAVKLQRIY